MIRKDSTVIYQRYAEWLIAKMPLGPRWTYQQIYDKIAERYADPYHVDACKAIEYLIASHEMTIVVTSGCVRFAHWPSMATTPRRRARWIEVGP